MRARTAAASPRGTVTEIIDASNTGVFLGRTKREEITLIIKIKTVRRKPSSRISESLKFKDIPIKIKKNIFTKNTISQKKESSLVDKGCGWRTA